jgi:hypothetical protein
MANSTTNVDPILPSQASKEVTANAFFDAASQGLTYGRRASTSSGLTWGFYGGNVRVSAGTLSQIANGTVTLTASSTNYIVAAKSSGSVSVSTATTNWDDSANYWRLYSVVTNASAPTSWTDARLMAQFTQEPGSGGGGGITALTGDVTASGSGSVVATIANGVVTLAKMATMATASLLGRNTAGTGAPEVLSAATVRTILGLATTDSPQFNAVNVGNASDTTLDRAAAGQIAVEGSRVFQRNNIIGTVSQSAGVPTGAIIEKGSNANGEYVRFADGTQICWSQAISAGAASTGTGSLFVSGTTVWTYPAAFVSGSTPSVSGYANRTSGTGISFLANANVMPSDTTMSARFLTTVTGTECTLYVNAIGRWY